MSFSNDLKTYLSDAEIQNECCRNAYKAGIEKREFNSVCKSCDAFFMRGIFISCGYTSPPDGRCELTFSFSDDFIFYVQGVLSVHGMDLRISTRKGKPIMYCKRREGVEDFFAFIGAGKPALTLMESAVVLDLRRDANRRNNAETANIDRTARACAEQLAAINYIIKQNRLQALPPELKEAAEIRIEHPEDSLDELRKYFSAPISKSGIKHRFLRISEAAESLRLTAAPDERK